MMHMKGSKIPMREISLRLYVCGVVCLLSFDKINPVKVLSELLNIHTAYFFLLSVLFFLSIVWGHLNDLIYYFTKIFLTSILSIFFSSIEVVGRENIPNYGPIIFTGNHMNQFVDAAIILCTTPHKVGFLVADKSYNKPGIGHFAKAMDSIPVARPQDTAVKGPGQIKVEGNLMIGKDTQFLKLNKRDKILDKVSIEGYLIKTIVSDTEIIIQGEGAKVISEGESPWLDYDILPFIDQSGMFDFVHAALAKGNCLGIFPEGGSHDNTNLLPLKAGIAAIAFGTMEKYSVNVPIIPVGLNYYRGHRFRGRVVVEFGTPMSINKETYSVFKNNRRDGYTTLLNQIEENMRGVLVTASDYKELQLLAAARRLYQDPTKVRSVKSKQDLARRFSVGFAILRKKYQSTGKGYKNMPEDIQLAIIKLNEYHEVLRKWGLRDYQVSTLDDPNPAHQFHTFSHALVVWLMASIPTLFLNLPVGIIVGFVARKEAKEDLKKSRVKLQARDVLLSKKILYSMAAVPALWLFWGLFLYIFMSLSFKATLVFLVSCPFFSYLGVHGAEAAMIDMKDFRPVFNRLFYKFREEVVTKLPKQRLELQTLVRSLVKKYGPELEELYSSDRVKWDEVIRQHFRGNVANDITPKEVSNSNTPSSHNQLGEATDEHGSVQKDLSDAVSETKEEDEEDDDDDDYEQRVSNVPTSEESTKSESSSSSFSHLPSFSVSLGLQNTDSTNDFILGYSQSTLKKASDLANYQKESSELSLEIPAKIEEESDSDKDPFVQIDAEEFQADETKKDK